MSDLSGEQLSFSGDPIEPIEPPPEVTEAPSPVVEDKTGLRDSIREAVKKASEDAAPEKQKERERTPNGEFVAKAPTETQPEELEKKPLEGAPPDVQKADSAPGTWKPDARAKWGDLDPGVKTEILRRESEGTREVTKYQDQLRQINEAYTPIEQIIGPRRAVWRAQFGSEAEALSRVLNASDLASSDPNAFLSFYIAQPDIAPKLDLDKVFGQSDVGTDDGITSHPVVQQLQQSFNGLNQQVSGFLNQQSTQELSSVESQIDAYASEKDAAGNLKRPHFESARPSISAIIPTIRAQFPNASVVEVMEKAYNTAIHTDPNLTDEIGRLNEQRIRASIEKEGRANKARIAGKSLPIGTPPGASSGSPSTSDLRATLVQNLRNYQDGQSSRV
jgi:hypothetical protein|tara:strand:- start:513 stop:1682 length:1170 start_codon:yes stop_codon:yes gene_type:complete